MARLNLFVIASAAVLLTACGFKPVHSAGSLDGKFGGGVAQTAMASTAIQIDSSDRADFLLKQALRDRMGNPAAAKYTLKLDPEITRGSVGIGADDIASRYDIQMNTRIVLTDNDTGDVLLRDYIRAVSTYGSPRDPYGTIAANENATEQVANEAADIIIARLARYHAKAGQN